MEYSKFDTKNKGLGTLFNNKMYMKHREYRGVKDTLYDFGYWLKTYAFVIKELVLKAPVQALKGMFRYKWMSSFLTIAAFTDKCTFGLRGYELRCAHIQTYAVVRGLTKLLKDMLIRDANINPKSKRAKKLRDKTIILDEMLPSQLMSGFPNLKFIPLQMLPVFVAGELDQDVNLRYIDVMENLGLPPDVCSLPTTELGCAFDDDYPEISNIFISSSMPCDSAIMATMFNDRKYPDKVTYQITPPVRFNEPEVQDYAVKNLKGAIKFIEEHTGEKFDWDAYFTAMKNYNTENEYMIKRWDINRTDYPQAGGPPSVNERLFEFQVEGGMDDYYSRNAKKLDKVVTKGFQSDKANDVKPRYRAVMWGIPAHYYSNFIYWAQNCWGIKTVMDMESMMSYHKFNTEDKEQTLIDLARTYEKMTMRSHSNGGYKNALDELWRVCKHWNANIVLMFNQVSCKNMAGLQGLFEEQALERGIHIIWIDHDLCDKRTVGRKDMRGRVNSYMQTIFMAEPLDPTLVEYEDDLIW